MQINQEIGKQIHTVIFFWKLRRLRLLRYLSMRSRRSTALYLRTSSLFVNARREARDPLQPPPDSSSCRHFFCCGFGTGGTKAELLRGHMPSLFWMTGLYKTTVFVNLYTHG